MADSHESEAHAWDLDEAIASYAVREPTNGEKRSEDVEEWLEELRKEAANLETWKRGPGSWRESGK